MKLPHHGSLSPHTEPAFPHTTLFWGRDNTVSATKPFHLPPGLWWLISCVNLTRPQGCPDIGPNIILGVSLEVLLSKINIWINRLSKADYPPSCGWALSNQLKACIEPKGSSPTDKISSCLTTSELEHLDFSCLHTWTVPSATQSLQLADSDLETSQPPQLHKPITCTKSLCVCVCPVAFVSLENLDKYMD